jgi:hypothetical protein
MDVSRDGGDGCLCAAGQQHHSGSERASSQGCCSWVEWSCACWRREEATGPAPIYHKALRVCMHVCCSVAAAGPLVNRQGLRVHLDAR